MSAKVSPLPERGSRGQEGLGTRLAGLLTRGPQGWRTPRAEPELALLETLNLGGRRQLMLVRCGRERFLVGAGVDGLSAIVRVESAGASGAPPEPTERA